MDKVKSGALSKYCKELEHKFGFTILIFHFGGKFENIFTYSFLLLFF